MSETKRAKLEAEIKRFQRKHLRLMTKEQVKREIIQLLQSRPDEDFSVADVAMELQTPMKAVIKGLVEMEAQNRIQPVIEALCREGVESVRLNPHFTPTNEQTPQSEHDVKEVLSLLENRCFLFEAGRRRAYGIMLSSNFF